MGGEREEREGTVAKGEAIDMCACMYNTTETERAKKAVGAAEKGEGYSLEKERLRAHDKERQSTPTKQTFSKPHLVEH